MEEMIDDTLEDLDEEDEELTEEADLEIEKVLFELTDGKLGQLGSAGKDLPVRLPPLWPLMTLTWRSKFFAID
jgi:charged multivesicular body protein 3